MEAGSIQEVKHELKELSQKDLVELCLKLAKYKKDNKEYLSYLLFKSHDKNAFVSEVKEQIDVYYSEISPATNLYYVKKNLRRTLRIIIKYSRYMDDKALSMDLYIYFLNKLLDSRIPFRNSKLLVNLYDQQIKKINALLSSLHEDLRADYKKDIERFTK
ncbi:MAG: hypothetical protein K0S32_2051 [Bacteroidetes bacterium]|jgi:membrane-anchored protein YejM (alkaline phosphatase superfamily)|nr:hypothetical protein [Bacteroidota bacterium]